MAYSDDRLAFHEPDPRVTIDERGGFVHVTCGDQRWCFPTNQRSLTLDERRILEALVKIYHRQLLGM